MKNRLVFGLGLLICGLGMSSVRANPIAENPVFKLLVGEWTGKGKLVDASGNETEVSETWTGKFTEDGNFIVSGTRKLGEAEHEFSWEFYANQDIIEGQMKMSEPEVDRRFEVTVNEEARSIEIIIPLGGNSRMKVVNIVSSDGKSNVGTVELINENGQFNMGGKVEHTRKES